MSPAVNAAADQLHGLQHHVKTHVVQHDYIHATVQTFLNLFQIFALHLDLEGMGRLRFDPFDR